MQIKLNDISNFQSLFVLSVQKFCKITFFLYLCQIWQLTKFFRSQWGPQICITVDLFIPIWGFLNEQLKWSYKGGPLALGTGDHFP